MSSSYDVVAAVNERMSILMLQFRLTILQRLALFSRKQTRGPLVKLGVQLSSDAIRAHLVHLQQLVNLPEEIVSGRLVASELPLSIDAYFPDWAIGCGADIAPLACEFMQWARDRLVLVTEASLEVEKAPPSNEVSLPFEGSAVVVCRTPCAIEYAGGVLHTVNVMLVSCLRFGGVPVVRIRPLHNPNPTTTWLMPEWKAEQQQRHLKEVELKPSYVYDKASKKLSEVQNLVRNFMYVDGFGYGECLIDLQRGAIATDGPSIPIRRYHPVPIANSTVGDRVDDFEHSLMKKCLLAISQVNKALTTSGSSASQPRVTRRKAGAVAVEVVPFVLAAEQLFVVDRATTLKPRRSTSIGRVSPVAHNRVVLSAPIKVETYSRRPPGKGNDPTAPRSVTVKAYGYNRTPEVTIGRGIRIEV